MQIEPPDSIRHFDDDGMTDTSQTNTPLTFHRYGDYWRYLQRHDAGPLPVMAAVIWVIATTIVSFLAWVGFLTGTDLMRAIYGVFIVPLPLHLMHFGLFLYWHFTEAKR